MGRSEPQAAEVASGKGVSSCLEFFASNRSASIVIHGIKESIHLVDLDFSTLSTTVWV